MTFLARSLKNLDEQIAVHGGRLQVLCGDPSHVLAEIIANHSISTVFVNRDYTPASRIRDDQLKAVCQDNGVGFVSFADQLLNEPESISKADGTPYAVFTAYFRQAKAHRISVPIQRADYDFAPCESASRLTESMLGPYLKRAFEPDAFDVSKALDGVRDLAQYDETRNLPSVRGTSHLSAHLRFGTCSVRQVYHRVADAHSTAHGLIRQLYWRDFYFHIGFHFPHVFRAAFQRKYDQLAWDDNQSGFEAWQAGETGFPIVDAGMRELLASGFMHNRVRMIVASFLTKNLLIDWRRGEAHFANHLVDFDPAINNGNWQWSASTGCDAQPYFRVINPWRQQLRFDRECRYIKQWIPELRGMEPNQIHRLETTGSGYLPTILDLKTTSDESKRRFGALRRPVSDG
jgi:deoxyribodipyrimidine photo-lyase